MISDAVTAPGSLHHAGVETRADGEAGAGIRRALEIGGGERRPHADTGLRHRAGDRLHRRQRRRRAQRDLEHVEPARDQGAAEFDRVLDGAGRDDGNRDRGAEARAQHLAHSVRPPSITLTVPVV
jgi:hypothetical protein